jgi:YD repeat-containing protein
MTSRTELGIVAAGACIVLGVWIGFGLTGKAFGDSVALKYKVLPLSSADLKEKRVGALLYRGGVEITSLDGRFGGWSGLLVSTDGSHMLSQSDEGHWLRATLTYDRNGNLSGITDAQLADMQALDGSKLAPKLEADAEALAALSDKGPGGPVAVSFERDARIWRYDLTSSLDVPPTDIPAPKEIRTLDFNSGLEGLTRFSPDVLFAVAETPQIRGNDHPAWLVPIPGRKPSRFEQLSVVHHDPYEISDAAMSPDDRQLYLLERHYFGPIRGVVVAVRRVDASAVKPGARLNGNEIAQFTMHENIDNMEGLALRRDAHGKTLLYMISDDNYNLVLQRTLLLMFEVEK